MKLITHNILMCNRKGCTKNNFPLRIIATQVQDYETEQAMEYNKNLIQRLMEKIEWPALRSTVQELGWQADLPEMV